MGLFSLTCNHCLREILSERVHLFLRLFLSETPVGKWGRKAAGHNGNEHMEIPEMKLKARRLDRETRSYASLLFIFAGFTNFLSAEISGHFPLFFPQNATSPRCDSHGAFIVSDYLAGGYI